MAPRILNGSAELTAAIGEHLGYSDWMEITQERVNQFADATGDHQWIHIDVERAKKESPFGGPIAHGYLTLSLAPVLLRRDRRRCADHVPAHLRDRGRHQAQLRRRSHLPRLRLTHALTPNPFYVNAVGR